MMSKRYIYDVDTTKISVKVDTMVVFISIFPNKSNYEYGILEVKFSQIYIVYIPTPPDFQTSVFPYIGYILHIKAMNLTLTSFISHCKLNNSCLYVE